MSKMQSKKDLKDRLSAERDKYYKGSRLKSLIMYLIGNDVVIGVGSTLVGGVRIADGIAIGANSLVNKSFEEQGIAIAGVPAKKISDNGKAKWNTKHINKDFERRS